MFSSHLDLILKYSVNWFSSLKTSDDSLWELMWNRQGVKGLKIGQK